MNPTRRAGNAFGDRSDGLNSPGNAESSFATADLSLLQLQFPGTDPTISAVSAHDGDGAAIDPAAQPSHSQGNSGTTGVHALLVNEATIPALPLGGGIVRPALTLDAAGEIVLDATSAAFLSAYGTKFLYAGLPASTPVPPVDPHHDFHLF